MQMPVTGFGTINARERGKRKKILFRDLTAWMYKNRSSRREERKASVLVRLQREWDEGKTGRPLYESCTQVGLDDLKCSLKMVQFLTGHGNMKDYLRCFEVRETE